MAAGSEDSVTDVSAASVQLLTGGRTDRKTSAINNEIVCLSVSSVWTRNNTNHNNNNNDDEIHQRKEQRP